LRDQVYESVIAGRVAKHLALKRGAHGYGHTSRRRDGIRSRRSLSQRWVWWWAA